MPRLPLYLFLIALAAPAVLAQAPATAAPAEADSVAGVVFLVREGSHARAALDSAARLRERAAYADVRLELVVCGGASRSLLAHDPSAAALTGAAEQAGVRLLACGLSLSALDLDPADLEAGVGVVPNGILHAIDRQAEGFLSVEL